MLDAFKRLIGASPTVRQDDWVAWCQERGRSFRVVREPEGFVIDGGSPSSAWRLEWGPAQRSYIEGFELRLRAEGLAPAAVQAMVLDRGLHQALERQVFEEYVGDVQTRVDTDMPPEMRWLVMLTKLPGASIKSIRSRFAAVASDVEWAGRWLNGPLADALSAWPPQSAPMVLTVGRGRLLLRTAVAQPEPASVEPWIALFETALSQAQRVADA